MDPATQAIRDDMGLPPRDPGASYAREFGDPPEPPATRVRLHADDLQHLARETARITREEMSGWDAMFTIAFRGGIAFGLVGFGFWAVWWVLAAVVANSR